MEYIKYERPLVELEFNETCPYNVSLTPLNLWYQEERVKLKSAKPWAFSMMANIIPCMITFLAFCILWINRHCLNRKGYYEVYWWLILFPVPWIVLNIYGEKRMNDLVIENEYETYKTKLAECGGPDPYGPIPKMLALIVEIKFSILAVRLWNCVLLGYLAIWIVLFQIEIWLWRVLWRPCCKKLMIGDKDR